MNETGKCSCSAGFQGPLCSSVCVEGRFGLNCNETCDCRNGSTLACHPVTGICQCKTNFRGVQCETTCRQGYYFLFIISSRSFPLGHFLFTTSSSLFSFISIHRRLLPAITCVFILHPSPLPFYRGCISHSKTMIILSEL